MGVRVIHSGTSIATYLGSWMFTISWQVEVSVLDIESWERIEFSFGFENEAKVLLDQRNRAASDWFCFWSRSFIFKVSVHCFLRDCHQRTRLICWTDYLGMEFINCWRETNESFCNVYNRCWGYERVENVVTDVNTLLGLLTGCGFGGILISPITLSWRRVKMNYTL